MSFKPPGLLAVKVEKWSAYTVHPWVFTTIARGYRFQFVLKPPSFNGVVFSEATGEATKAVESKISSLLSQRAIRIVPEEEINLGFYS